MLETRTRRAQPVRGGFTPKPEGLDQILHHFRDPRVKNIRDFSTSWTVNWVTAALCKDVFFETRELSKVAAKLV